MKTSKNAWSALRIILPALVLGWGGLSLASPLPAGWAAWQAWTVPSLPPPPPASGEDLGRGLSIVTATDVDASAFFILSSKTSCKAVELSVSPIRGKDEDALSSVPDIRIVKSWYQDANGLYGDDRTPGSAILVPGLLLHDDTLVKTDREGRANLVRTSPAGAAPVYRRIPSSPAGCVTPSVPGFVAADDTPTLQPFPLTAGEPRAFHLRLPIPSSAAEGVYKGHVLVKSDGREVGRIGLSVRILHHRLPLADSRFSESFWSGRSERFAPGRPVLGSSPSPRRFLTGGRLPDRFLSPSSVSFLADAGFVAPLLPVSGADRFKALQGHEALMPIWTAAPLSPGSEADARSLAAKVRHYGERGILLCPDAAPRRAFLEELADEGISVMALSGEVLYTNCPDLVSIAVQDGLVLPFGPSRSVGGYGHADTRQLERWHAIGTPCALRVDAPASIGSPAFWRRRLGVEVFHLGYDGFLLPEIIGGEDPWNEWASPDHRARALLYPTESGFITTLAWEGIREAIIDARYLSSATRLAACARATGDVKLDLEGRKCSMKLDELDPLSVDLDTLRLELLAWIDRLEGCIALADGGKGMGADPLLPRPVAVIAPESTPWPQCETPRALPPRQETGAGGTGTVYKVPLKALDGGSRSGETRRAFLLENHVALVPFRGENGMESISAAVSYDAEGFAVDLLAVRASPLEKGEEAGGTVRMRLLDGKDNTSGLPPVDFTYRLERQAKPFVGLDVHVPVDAYEESALRTPSTRWEFHSPLPFGRSNPDTRPDVSFHPTGEGWVATFRFHWGTFSGRVPFASLRSPVPWRLMIERRTDDGRKMTWGTPSAPVLLQWARPSGAFSIGLENDLAQGQCKAVRWIGNEAIGKWSAWRQEEAIGYADPGRETFEEMNPASNRLYLERVLTPMVEEARKTAGKVSRVSKSPSEREGLLAQAARLGSFRHLLDDLRRDYLLDRFLGREIREPELSREQIEKREREEREKAPAEIDGEWHEDPAFDITL